ncbi:hypothetical protein CIRG_08375 [Coccidioides immitis RMSCC 2394]|uniref:Uncharacterized protein n=1 Tax=Coccidioides immitis RMSCC 2394 TaxID=404692 RepID=A0A0J6YNF0_COCIT|nr:hypothetical protein CIRG_08375 [Coccidioides immitis RMSCC 2394]
MDTQARPSRSKYRPTKQLSFELREHCGVYFEEQLYCHGLNLLLSLLSSGSATPDAPVPSPPPEFLAVAATIVVHPSTTTRAKSADNKQAANIALQLLRLTNSLVGPLAANFDAAFTFTHFTKSRSGARRAVADDGAEKPMEKEALNFELAHRGALWSRAEDFWHVVGWAFNCAVLHPSRWPRWRLLLEFLCEALEADWRERMRLVVELERDPEGETAVRAECERILCGSLIYQYYKATSGVSSPDRRMMRAIFADGTPGSTNEFREVFHKELLELKEETAKPRKREVNVNIDEEIYGDYLEWDVDDDESDSVRNELRQTLPTRPKRQRTTKARHAGNDDVDKNYDLLNRACSENLTMLGDLDSLALRQRFLAIISRVSASIPDHFMSVDRLYLLYVDFIRHLPLPIFQVFVSPSVLCQFSVDAQTTLCEMLLERLCESRKPTCREPYLTQDKLELDFLPYAASTSDTIDNARMSILLESVLRLLAASGLLQGGPSLKEAVEMGIEARAEKALKDTKIGQSKMKAEEFGWTWLIESGERLTCLVERVAPPEPPVE